MITEYDFKTDTEAGQAHNPAVIEQIKQAGMWQ